MAIVQVVVKQAKVSTIQQQRQTDDYTEMCLTMDNVPTTLQSQIHKVLRGITEFLIDIFFLKFLAAQSNVAVALEVERSDLLRGNLTLWAAEGGDPKS